MLRYYSSITLSIVLAIASALSVVNAVETGRAQIVSKVDAQAGACTEYVEITAGTTGSIEAYANPDFGGACLPGTINGWYPGLTFNSVYSETGSCSNGDPYTRYITTEYDATGLTGVTEPFTLSFGVDGIQDSGGECTPAWGSIEITILPDQPSPSFNCSANPVTTTIDPGSNTSYGISTTGFEGFNSAVNFTSSISPSTGTLPNVTFTNNGQVPPNTTTAVVSTTGNTTPATYTITFTGTGGGHTSTCSTQLIVNPLRPNFELTLSPTTGVTPDPNRTNIGATPTYTVFASCTGGFAGPVTSLTASSTFEGVTLTLGASSIACGATTTLTVGNTAGIPTGQQSSITNIISESLSVSGSGIL